MHLGTVKNFKQVIWRLKTIMKKALPVHQVRWQGRDVSKDPSARVYESMNVGFEVFLGDRGLDHWKADIKPNLPWADDHFMERVGGEPLNPGVEWANWPWGNSANTFREGEEEIFNHTYMERLWPKWARKSRGGHLPLKKRDDQRRYPNASGQFTHRGVAFEYGDLQSLVEYIASEPYTRQAWIPLFFPEDTGYGDGGRKPCTLGYQFMLRNGQLHIWYPLRSCDLIRHFPDDCYLAVRLLMWVLDQCRAQNPEFWLEVTPGTYSMHMTSLHIFENDRRYLDPE
jgi:hypothetical protein